MTPLRHSTAERRAAIAAIPLALATLIVVLVCGGFGGAFLWPWVLLIATGLIAIGRFARAGRMSPAHSVECGLLAGVAALSLTDVTQGSDFHRSATLAGSVVTCATA